MVDCAPPPDGSVAMHAVFSPRRSRAESTGSSSISSVRSARTLASGDVEYVHENGRTYGNHTYYLPCAYMPDDDLRQQDLLALQHNIFVHALQGKLTTTRLLPSTRRILDLGTGPGHWAVAMAQQYPHAEVVGIDMTEWDLSTTEATLGGSKVMWELDDLDVWGTEMHIDSLLAGLEKLDLYTNTTNRVPVVLLNQSNPQSQPEGEESSDVYLTNPYDIAGPPVPGWHFSEPFEFIHLRNMKGAFVSWEEVYAEIYKSLSPGGWIELADYDLGQVPLRSETNGSDQVPMPTLRRLYKAGIEASFKSGRPIGTFYMHPSYLEEAGFTDVQTTTVNLPVGQWVEDETQKSIGKLVLVVLMETIEAGLPRLLTQYGDKDKIWTLEEVMATVEDARSEIVDWCARAERGEVEGCCATFKWITARKSWHD